jgi:DNA-binding NtrC family response regulator
MSLDKPRILVIDDERTALEFLTQALSGLGFEVATAEDGEKGVALYAEGAFDMVLVDLAMPRMGGIEVIQRVKSQNPDAVAVVMTGFGSIESAVEAMKVGAIDYLTKPLDLDYLEIVLKKVIEGRRQAEKLHLLEDQVVHQGSFEGLVGVSQEMQRIYGLIRQLATNDATVLIQGETGTGKELVSKAIHNLSSRREVGFLPINCGALPETILESELFGHEKGAFTNAIKLKYGLIEQAAGGTLFLDEIEEMSPALQVKLLRAIQEKEVLRVGGDRPIPVDFRLIAATNVDLRERMEQKLFRADLFYRLSVVVVDLPPLRARRGDIPLLTHHFLTLYAEKGGQRARDITPEALMVLKAYAWPGNVRELEHAIHQAVLLSTGEKISIKDLPEHIVTSVSDREVPDLQGGPDFTDMSMREARERFERQYLEKMLTRAGGRVAEAARRAGINRQNFYEKMKRYGISRK